MPTRARQCAVTGPGSASTGTPPTCRRLRRRSRPVADTVTVWLPPGTSALPGGAGQLDAGSRREAAAFSRDVGPVPPGVIEAILTATRRMP